MPIVIKLDVSISDKGSIDPMPINTTNKVNCSAGVNWGAMTESDRNYGNTELNLKSIKMCSSVFSCKNPNCVDVNHKKRY